MVIGDKTRLQEQLQVAHVARLNVSEIGSSYVAEHTGYHHGEASLQNTIVNMAQNYVGTNNLPLLCPIGQYGTRHVAGKDSGGDWFLFDVRISWNTKQNSSLVTVDLTQRSLELFFFCLVYVLLLRETVPLLPTKKLNDPKPS